MIAVLRRTRNPLLKLAALASALWVAACEPAGLGGPGFNPNKPVPVALLVPGGSGNSGDEVIARALRQAADLAIADLDGVRIDLRVYNTGGSPAQAAQVAAQAVSEGAKIILGPVYAESANAVGAAVAAKGVNVLSFSNNTTIAGGNVFVLGPTFENTASRLVSYAARQGKTRIAIVHDRTAAGDLGRAAISGAIARSGASVAGVTAYEFSQQGVTVAVPAIVEQVRSSGANALFFTADTAGALPLLAQMLPAAGVDPAAIKFIGLTRWDIPQATLAMPGVQGGWFALPDPALNNQFQSRFLGAYGEIPHPIAGLAYDGIAAIGALAKTGSPDALSRASITQGAGFVGVNGVFRLRGDGTNERGLAIAEIRSNQVFIIDAAPRSFGGAGF